MRLERLLQINVATLAALGTILLSMGQNEGGLPVIVVLAAVTSVVVTDIKDWFHLNRMVANIAALIAAGFAARHLSAAIHAVPLLAIARFLIYLQVILLFQKKDARLYWQLCTLSFLQVVVAAAFNQGFVFGVLLVGYLFIGLSTLALFYLYREDQTGRRIQSGPARKVAKPPVRRWPLAAAEAVVVGQSARIRGKQGLGWELYKRLGAFSVGTLILTSCIFFVVPRLGRTAWRGAMLVERRTVGFSSEVELGELGTTVENPDEVGRVALADELTGETLRPGGGLYLHGAVLTTYEGGRWKEPYTWADTVREMRERSSLPEEGMARQKIMLEPLDTNEIFHVRPAYIRRRRDDLFEDVRREKILRPTDLTRGRFTVELLTTALADGRQAPWTPAWVDFSQSELLQMPAGPEGTPGLPWLRGAAERWLAEANIPPDDPVRVARYLEHRLRDTGLYKYSLQGQPRDPKVDPIEDFVANNRSGNCEYFATALAMMLRSRGIPSRMIVGYKTEEWNEVGGFFQVRQLHAHTWVEARILAEAIPAGVLADRNEWVEAKAGWLRLDPTAGDGAETVSVTEGVLSPVTSLLDRIEFLWDNYVMEMDQGRQSRVIYEPLRDWAENTFAQLRDPQWWADLGAKTWRALNPANWNIEQWFSWRGGAVAVVVCLLFAGIYQLFRLARAWIARNQRRRRQARRAAARAAQVEFYRRFEMLMARRRLAREVNSTHREFALQVGRAFAREEDGDGVGPLACQLTDAFYRVRFAHRPLDPEERVRIDALLGKLEQAVDPAKG